MGIDRRTIPRKKHLIQCVECGVEFLGKTPAKYCPMCRRERSRQQHKKYQDYLRENGWCLDCGAPVEEGRKRCRKCLDRFKLFNQKKKA